MEYVLYFHMKIVCSKQHLSGENLLNMLKWSNHGTTTLNDHRIRRYQSINRYRSQSLIGHARTYVRVHNIDDYRLKNHGGKPDFGLSLQQCATLRDYVMAKGKSQMHST